MFASPLGRGGTRSVTERVFGGGFGVRQGRIFGSLREGAPAKRVEEPCGTKD